MNKKLLGSLLATAMVCSTVMATDFRAPLPGRWGSLRYDFDKIEKGKSAFNVWSTGYMREADKAFMKHGFDTHPYTSLIFGKESFIPSEAFEGGSSNFGNFGYTENRNPYLNSVTLAPRVSYTERGIVLGAQWTYPIWSNKGRIGLRGSIPLRSVRMEKDDELEHAAAGNQNQVISGEARFINPATNDMDTRGAGANRPRVISNIKSYNLRFLASVKTLDGAGNPVGLFRVDNAAHTPYIGGIPFTDQNTADAAAQATANAVGSTGRMIPGVIVKSTAPGQPPFGLGGAMLYSTAGATSNFVNAPTGDTRVRYISPIDGTTVTGQGTAFPVLAADFSTAIPAGRAALLATGATAAAHNANYDLNNIPRDLWFTLIHGDNGSPVDVSDSARGNIDSALSFYQNDLTGFFAKAGYEFQTYQLTGLGDADLDVFYNHQFSNSWNGELFAGVRLPTGSGDKYYGNPYRMFLGNGDHFEIKVGGKIAWATCNWLHLKAQAQYSFALEATEHRMAAFKGATIKNLGPKADADVSWGYFVGDIDVTLFHPKTSTLATTIGYELYYKTEDSISFKNKTMTDHWLGGQWDNTAGVQKFVPFNMELDNKVARKDTESIGHRVYVEGNYDFSKYLRVFLGGKYTFAGQNIPVETEGYGGLNVKF